MHGGADAPDAEGALDAEGAATATSGYAEHSSAQGRSRAEIPCFFDGLERVEPGLVTAPARYKDAPAPELAPFPGCGEVARVV